MIQGHDFLLLTNGVDVTSANTTVGNVHIDGIVVKGLERKFDVLKSFSCKRGLAFHCLQYKAIDAKVNAYLCQQRPNRGGALEYRD
jgi:hypothetical protein